MSEFFQDFGEKIGIGSSPAILVVDFINGFTDPSSPLGSDLDSEIEATRKLLDTARSVDIPIIFFTVSYSPGYKDGGYFVEKVPALKILIDGDESTFVDERLGRRPELEPLIVKKYPSAFFGTHLDSLLNILQVDTTIIVGCTTSGCVRATAVDGVQYGYRVIVPEECVGDRSKKAHSANLYDINLKYGDVLSVSSVIKNLKNRKSSMEI